MGKRRNYSIKKNRYKNSYLKGFEINGDSSIVCDCQCYDHHVVLEAIDGIYEDATWGRLKFKCEFDEDMIYTVYAYATNYEAKTPENMFLQSKKMVNANDFLLYDLKGRYLYIMIDVKGMGNGYISDMRVDNQGDFLMDSLPELYHDYGGFYHRYLSVFSSLFMDMEEEIENIDYIFDLDKTPVQFLPVFGKWLGIDLSGNFLTEDKLRTLVKEAYYLNRMKGTKTALLRLTEIVLGKKAIILEKNHVSEDVDESLNLEDLYGKSDTDVVLLIDTYVPENQKSQLLFLLNQFVPIRCNLNIKFLDESSGMDGHLYLDMNSSINENKDGELDKRQAMDGTVLLG